MEKTHAENLAFWAKRRQEAARLRNKDKGYWTYWRLGEKFGVSAERVRQWVKKEKKNGHQKTE